MPTFICSLSWTEQGIRFIKDALKRRQQSRDLAAKLGITIKDIYVTSGDRDIMMILDAPNGDSVAKFALVVGSRGNTRTSTRRAFTEAEFEKMLQELPEVS
jgi:uncharacterized protein with GYD domain